MLVVRALALAETREVESFFLDGLLYVKDAHQMDSILDSELDVKLTGRHSMTSPSKISF